MAALSKRCRNWINTANDTTAYLLCLLYGHKFKPQVAYSSTRYWLMLTINTRHQTKQTSDMHMTTIVGLRGKSHGVADEEKHSLRSRYKFKLNAKILLSKISIGCARNKGSV
jgi:hypothetical protein